MGDGYCEAIVKSTGQRCTNKSKSKGNGLCGVHVKSKNLTRVDLSKTKPPDQVKSDKVEKTERVASSTAPIKVVDPSEIVGSSGDAHCDQVQKFALAKLKEHKLDDWSFAWDKAVRRFGCCHHKRKRITLSLKLTKINKMEDCQDTVLHEIAHALAGHKEGHGDGWKAICVKIGAKPERCYDSEEVAAVTSKYTEYCSHCDYTYPRHRKSPPNTNPKACGRCCKEHNDGKFSDKFLLKLRQNY